MTADRQRDAVTLRKLPLWRRVTPQRLGFLLALALTLPWAIDAARTHMLRSMLRDASDETTFVVYGGLERYSAIDAVSRAVLRTVSELAPDADWTLRAGCGAQWDLCLRITTEWSDRDGRHTRDVLTLENAGPLAIRVNLKGDRANAIADCRPAWLTQSRSARPWRACLPGSTWPN
jgi:hypothetical protein